MALCIAFTKERISYLIDCLTKHKPIEPNHVNGWTHNDTLVLGGVCFFVTEIQGPPLHSKANISRLSQERLEFIQQQFKNDIRTAIEFYALVAEMILNGEYDSHFEEEVSGVIEHCDDGSVKVHRENGFK